jgi:stage II sporulation protein AA (anti-sigma F factor antagonist)
MQVKEEREGDALILCLQGRLDSANAKALEAALLAPVQAGEKLVVLDLSTLDYISSAGLRVVLIAAKQQKAKQGRFALCGLRDEIREVFEISGFAKILDIRPTRKEILAP